MGYPLAFPTTLTVVKASRPRLSNPSRGGGPGLDGTEQLVVAPGGGRWTWSVTIQVRTRDDVLDLDAFILGMAGRAGTAIVPIFDGQRAPWNVDPLTGGFITPAKAAYDRAIDPAYDTNPDTTGALAFTLGAVAEMNATTLTVARATGGVIRPGMFLSIGAEMHVVTALDTPDAGGPATLSVSILPWLRDDHPAGTAVEFASPVCLARLASDDTGKLDLDLLRFGQVTLDFVEAF